MPDLKISDSLGNPVDISSVKWTSASSLFHYLKSELLHLIVVPEFMQLRDKPLTQAAPAPVSFKLSVKHDFQLGDTAPEIDLTPSSEIKLTANTTAGSDPVDDDDFHLTSAVPDATGYVGMSLTGAVDVGLSGSSGELSFGIDKDSGITIEFLKAFPLEQEQPTLWNATAAMISAFVIPASIPDLRRLNANDICTVSGKGSLKIGGSVDVSLPLNPLASVNLPLGTGTLAVNDGVLAGLSASITLSGSYQIRLEKFGADIIRLSYIRGKSADMQTDLTASAGVSVTLGSTDLLAKFLGTIGSGKVDQSLLDGLASDDVDAFTSAIKDGINHSVEASIDAALSTLTENDAAFQYEIQTDLLDDASAAAVTSALRGDLRLLTALEENAQADGTIARGVKLLNSVFSTAKTKNISLTVNLLGIINLISSSELIGKCEFLFEPASGDLTIKETAQSERISAITEPYKRQAALRKALFDSVLTTTTYVVSKAITMPSLTCKASHFGMDGNADGQTIADYLGWFAALNLLRPQERDGLINLALSGKATCVVKSSFDEAACGALFFDDSGKLRAKADYLEIGRRALRMLLNPANGDVEKLRCQILDNPAIWRSAIEMGPSPQLRTLIPVDSTNPAFNFVLEDIKGDVYDIVWWADSMVNAGAALQDMRTFLAGRNPATLASDAGFASRRDKLQKLMLKVVSTSKVRFQEPWGVVCLYLAAGSRQSSGKITTPQLTLQRTTPAEEAVASSRSAGGS